MKTSTLFLGYVTAQIELQLADIENREKEYERYYRIAEYLHERIIKQLEARND